jgi:prepilin-type N-terminal cleavage/methylation domain-containing protein
MKIKSQIPNPKSQPGFTLIELIVVITVMAILSTIGVVSFVGYSQAQTLNQATSDLVQTLNTAKSLSASQLKTLSKNGKQWQCLTYQTLNGYGVEINTTNASHEYYVLYMQCVAGGIDYDYPDPSSITDWRTNLPSDVLFGPATNVADVFFPILSGGVVTTPVDADSIVLTSHNNTKTISFKNGIISVSQ